MKKIRPGRHELFLDRLRIKNICFPVLKGMFKKSFRKGL